jgi:hypothetical protein
MKRIDPREICRYCLNSDTTKLNDDYDLQPFREYHGTHKITAVYCHCCKATWHYKN